MRKPAIWVLAVIGLIAVALTGNTLRNWANVVAIKASPEARHAQLSAAWRVVPARSDVSQVRAVLLSGCDGVHDNVHTWASFIAERSARPSLIVDSHGPRGLDRLASWRLVCAGQLLTGSMRAGDLAIALAATRASEVAVLGASHGGWTALEFLRLAQSGADLPGLRSWPAPPDTLLQKVDHVVLLYPYCGFMNRARTGDWSHMPPILLISAGDDKIVDTDDCVALAESLRAQGARIEMHVLPGAGHGFDQRDKAFLSPLTYDAQTTRRAQALVSAFLERPRASF